MITLYLHGIGGLLREENEITVMADRDIYNLNFGTDGEPNNQLKVSPFIYIA